MSVFIFMETIVTANDYCQMFTENIYNIFQIIVRLHNNFIGFKMAQNVTITYPNGHVLAHVQVHILFVRHQQKHLRLSLLLAPKMKN